MIADDLSVDGDIKGDGELHIDGTVRGDIRIGKLTLGETGHIEGNVYAESIEVRGRIVGSVTAKAVRLFATAHVDGDITHEQLSMEPGAFFQGRAQKFQRPTASAGTEIEAEFTPLKTLKAVVKPAPEVWLPNP